MAVEAAATHNACAGAPQPADREKEFFTTWLRLMERLKDAQDLTQALQSVLDQPGDVGSTLQDARHQANMLGANDKTISGLVQLLNDFFFRDIVPALKRAKTAAQQQQQQQQQQWNPLDRYLEHGDEGASMSQTFVDNMSGWAAPPGRQPTEQRKKQTAAGQGGEAAETDDFLSDDEIPSDKFHDMLIENNLKVIAWQAPDYSAMAPPQQPAAPAPERGDAGDRAVKSTSQGKTSKRCRVVPPPIVTDLPPRSASVGSTPRAQSRSPDASAQKDRIGKRAAADLVAQQVLRARMYGSAREYMIRWEGVVQPLWISRRKAPRQAKELIDLFSAELRAQEAEAARRAGAGQTRTRGGSAKRKATRTGARPSGAAAVSKTPEAEFYTVDHIVNHRTHYNKRQYQVRWENYDASDDTWENGDKLRADVPDIVDAYEAQLERDQTRAEALESAMSELNRDTAARPKSTAKKRGVAEVSAEEAANPTTLSPDRADGEQAKEKRPRIATEKENKGKDGDGGNSDEDDYQFDLEEAELEEFSEDEYADRLHA